ncbi:MAG: hypothetical protein AAF527_04055 [Pseudomonadota bacterium]
MKTIMIMALSMTAIMTIMPAASVFMTTTKAEIMKISRAMRLRIARRALRLRLTAFCLPAPAQRRGG